jgi:P27 family predicted phage terminase small subunit
MPGPSPKPRELRVMEGNPSHNKLPEELEGLAYVEPTPPFTMQGKARDEWNRIVPILMRIRLLTEADGYILAEYCEAIRLIHLTKKKLDAEGLTVERVVATTGEVKEVVNPNFAVYTSAISQAHKAAMELGMTPSARTKVAPGQKKDGRLGRLGKLKALRGGKQTDEEGNAA